MSREISNSEDVIDSRDLIEQLESLQSDRDVLLQAITDIQESIDEGDDSLDKVSELTKAQEDLKEFDEDSDTGGFLKILQSVNDECEGYASDWRHGETLIRGTYWVDYCEELCKDIGDVPKDIPHYIEIDWEKTAQNISADYTTIDFDGVEYYIRNS